MRPRLAIWIPVLGAALGGCLSSDSPEDGPVVLCESNDDCDGDEVCDRGFCYGNPPAALEFAAVLQPPAAANVEDGQTLVPTEIALLEIAEDGELLNIQFERHVTITGSVEIPCSTDDPGRMCGPISAKIEARRASRIPGVPKFFRTFETRVDENGNLGFQLTLPPSLCDTDLVEDCADAYELVVTPQPGTSAAIIPDGTTKLPVEQLVPPQAFDMILATDDDNVVLEVGDPDKLKLVTGRIAPTTMGTGQTGYDVRAFGRETGLSDPIRASTIASTDSDGTFSLWVRNDLTQRFDFVFEPNGTIPDPLPTIRLIDQLVLDITLVNEEHQLPPILMPNIPGAVELSVPISAASTAGDRVPVGGATVLFSTELDTTDITPAITASYSTQVTSFATEEEGPIGNARAQLFAGTTYDVVVLPPSDGEFAARFDAEVQTGSANGTTGAIELGRRNAMRGVFVNHDGVPIADAPVTAQASPRFMFELVTDPESTIDITQLIREMTFSVVSGDDGAFFMWLDADLADSDAAYDITIEPPLAADAPRWTFEDREAPAGSTDLGQLVLPRAAYAKGFVLDPDGNPVPGAKLEIYEITSGEFCNNDCTPAPLLRGTFVADETGEVHPVVLPDPNGSTLRR